MKISPGFRINKINNLIMVETPGKMGESALKDSKGRFDREKYL